MDRHNTVICGRSATRWYRKKESTSHNVAWCLQKVVPVLQYQPVTMAKRSSSLLGLILINSCLRFAATSVLLSTNSLTGWLSERDASSSTCQKNKKTKKTGIIICLMHVLYLNK